MAQRFYMPYSIWFNGDGVPSAGWKLYFYEGTASGAGTTTPRDTYSNFALTIANTNPVVADANGKWGSIFLASGFYHVVLTEPGGDPLSPWWSANPVTFDSGEFYAGGVESIADLRTLAVSAANVDNLVYVKSYYPAVDGYPDGGQGWFRVTDVDPGADNNGTIIASDTAGFWYIRQIDGAGYCFNMWGVPTDGSNASPRFQQACDSVSDGSRIGVLQVGGEWPIYSFEDTIRQQNVSTRQYGNDPIISDGSQDSLPGIVWNGDDDATIFEFPNCGFTFLGAFAITSNGARVVMDIWNQTAGATRISTNCGTKGTVITNNDGLTGSKVYPWADEWYGVRIGGNADDNGQNCEFHEFHYSWLHNPNRTRASSVLGTVNTGGFGIFTGFSSNNHGNIIDTCNFDGMDIALGGFWLGAKLIGRNDMSFCDTNIIAPHQSYSCVLDWIDSESSNQIIKTGGDESPVTLSNGRFAEVGKDGTPMISIGSNMVIQGNMFFPAKTGSTGGSYVYAAGPDFNGGMPITLINNQYNNLDALNIEVDTLDRSTLPSNGQAGFITISDPCFGYAYATGTFKYTTSDGRGIVSDRLTMPVYGTTVGTGYGNVTSVSSHAITIWTAVTYMDAAATPVVQTINLGAFLPTYGGLSKPMLVAKQAFAIGPGGNIQGLTGNTTIPAGKWVEFLYGNGNLAYPAMGNLT